MWKVVSGLLLVLVCCSAANAGDPAQAQTQAKIFSEWQLSEITFDDLDRAVVSVRHIGYYHSQEECEKTEAQLPRPSAAHRSIGCFASAEPPSPEKPGWLLDEKPPVRFTIGASGSGGVSAEQARSSPSAGPVWLLLLPMNPNQHSWRGFGTFESLRDCERHISEEMPAALPADEQGRHYFYITDKDGNKVLSSMWFECRRGG